MDLFSIQNGVLVKYAGPGGTVKVPDGVRVIGAAAFSRCTRVTRVELPEGLEEIQTSAFVWCDGLTEIHLPAGLRRVGANAFRLCDRLERVSAAEGLEELGMGAFALCGRLLRADLPASLRLIGEEVFEGCPRLLVETPAGSCAEGWALARGLPVGHRLSEDGYVRLDGGFLVRDGVLTRSDGPGGAVEVPAGVRAIGARAFAESALTHLTLPEGVEEIGEGAFEWCDDLEEVRLPASLRVIGAEAFAECYALNEVRLPEGLTRLGQEAFRNCIELLWARLPGGLADLGLFAFDGCDGLTLCAPAFSPAAAYAKKFGIPFEWV